MPDEVPVATGAETNAAVEPVVEAQGATPEAKTTETTATEAVTETAATEPERITKAEAEALANATAAKAVADLQRRYDEKLQANAHNTKLAEVLEGLKDQLAGKKPVDPNALPEGFDYLPEPIQKHLLNLGSEVRAMKEERATAAQQSARAAEMAIQNNVESARLKLANDPTKGKLFQSIEDKIAADITNKPFIREWVRKEPEEALATLFAKYAPGQIATATAQAAASKATAGVRASSKPSSVGGGAPITSPIEDGMSAVDKAWEEHGAKVLQFNEARS